MAHLVGLFRIRFIYSQRCNAQATPDWTSGQAAKRLWRRPRPSPGAGQHRKIRIRQRARAFHQHGLVPCRLLSNAPLSYLPSFLRIQVATSLQACARREAHGSQGRPQVHRHQGTPRGRRSPCHGDWLSRLFLRTHIVFAPDASMAAIRRRSYGANDPASFGHAEKIPCCNMRVFRSHCLPIDGLILIWGFVV